jgi:UDP-N-acetylmuramoylalanine--D-glutamate ligase
LGGSDKGAEFNELAKTVKESGVKHAIVIGQIADKISGALAEAGFTNITTGLTTMTEIVNKARQLAEHGDVVLLSTAAASFGLFKDYKDRGNQFKQAHCLKLSDNWTFGLDYFGSAFGDVIDYLFYPVVMGTA